MEQHICLRNLINPINMMQSFINFLPSYFNSLNERFDPFKIFSYKKSANEKDPKYGKRAIVIYKTEDGTRVVSLFPPIQLRTTDNKYEFNRHLNAYIDSLKKDGNEFVSVHQEGDPVFTKYARGIPKES